VTINILIVDDHTLVRQGLASLLSKQEGIAVIGEASDGREAIEFCRNQLPDVLLMDVSMPRLNGVESTRLLLAEFPHARVLALSMHRDRMSVERMLLAGARGYILKSALLGEILIALHYVANGHHYVSPEVMTPLIDLVLCQLQPETAASKTGLSTRENEVLQLIAEGLTSKEIALNLNISPRTVDNHRQNIMTRLNITTVAGLTKYALRAGLTTLDF